MPNHDRFECQTVIDSDAILHNTQVSSEARICPNCGIKKPYRSKITSILFLLIIAVVAYSKFNSNGNVTGMPTESTTSRSTFNAPKVDVTAKQINPFNIYQVCRAGIATTMGRDIDTVKVSTSPSSEIVLLSYKRPHDGKSFSYQCKLSGDFIIYSEAGVSTNRWEGHGEIDSLLTYMVNADSSKAKDNLKSTLTIEEKYPDGSQITNNFTLSQLLLPKHLRGN